MGYDCLQSTEGRCNCSWEIACRNANDPQCQVVSNLKFKCLEPTKGSVLYERGTLLIFYERPTDCQAHESDDCLEKHLMALKHSFVNHAIAMKTESMEKFQLQVNIWEAGLYSLVHS